MIRRPGPQLSRPDPAAASVAIGFGPRAVVRPGFRTGPPVLALGFVDGQRLGYVLELPPLSRDAPGDLGQAAHRHDTRADVEGDRDLAGIPAADEVAEQQWTADAAHRGADRVEERDRQRPRLHREDLGRGQVRGARARRGQEEGGHDHADERPLVQLPAGEQPGEHRAERRRAQVGP